MNIPRSMIEVGARAIAKKAYQGNDVWLMLPDGSREVYLADAEAAIRAAIGCAEVEHENEGDREYTVELLHKLNPGDTIIIVRGEP